MRTAAIICAAGQGKRMRLGMNKQFLELEGKPLLIHTLEGLQQCEHIQEYVIVVGAAEVEQVRGLVQQYNIPNIIGVVVGGNERQDSVYQGLLALNQQPLPPKWVIVHDGARPFVQQLEMDKLMDTVMQTEAAIFAVPVKDTIKQVAENGEVSKTLDRAQLWGVQTPQAFSYTLLKQAHEHARKRSLQGTDDASLVEHLGNTVSVVTGREDNIKLTTPEDIALAEYIIKRRKK